MAAAIVDANLSKTSVADKTGIPYSTLSRKLKGRGDFSFEELFAIARATGVPASTFTPSAFAAERVAV